MKLTIALYLPVKTLDEIKLGYVFLYKVSLPSDVIVSVILGDFLRGHCRFCCGSKFNKKNWSTRVPALQRYHAYDMVMVTKIFFVSTIKTHCIFSNETQVPMTSL